MKLTMRLILTITLFTLSFISSAEELTPSVSRATLTSAIESREPVDNWNRKTISSSTQKIFLFSEVLGNAGSIVKHRWFLNGQLEAEVVLNTGSNQWRTYSSKNLDPALHSGNWEVTVVDAYDMILATQTFTYGQ